MAKAKENIVTELTTGIPGWVKGLIWGGVIFGGVYLGYRIYKGVSKAIIKLKNDQDIKDEIKRQASLGKGLSYPDIDYRTMADEVFACLDGYFTEDEEDLEPIFARMKTKADVLELIRVYGMRDISMVYPPMSLNEAIKRYVTGSDKEYVNGPLRRNGVDYQFN